MEYQIWTKDQYADLWTREDCGDQEAAKRSILAARQAGKEVAMTVEVPFELLIEVGKPGDETKKPKTPKTETPGDKTKEEVKSGPEASQPEGN